MKFFATISFIALFICYLPISASSQTINLFNGKDLSGWHADVPELDTNKNAVFPFVIRNGLLVSLGTPHGHLITDGVYKDYMLEVEYRFAVVPGNCGVLLLAATPPAWYKMYED